MFKCALRAVVTGLCLAPLAMTAALASDPDEYTLDPATPSSGTTTTTGSGG